MENYIPIVGEMATIINLENNELPVNATILFISATFVVYETEDGDEYGRSLSSITFKRIFSKFDIFANDIERIGLENTKKLAKGLMGVGYSKISDVEEDNLATSCSELSLITFFENVDTDTYFSITFDRCSVQKRNDITNLILGRKK